MSRFFLRNIFGARKLEEVLALDIGTEVVKALILRIDEKNSKAVVIGSGKVRQKMGNMQSGAISDILGVVDVSKSAIEIAKNEAGVSKITHGVVGVAGELVKGTTTTVHYERARPELKIDLAELKNIVQKVQQKAYERIKEQIAWETGQEDIAVQLINASITDVNIDGYQVSNPLEFQGQNVSISVFNAYAPTVHLGAVETIVNELGIDLISIVAEPYAVARSVDFEGDLSFNAIFIDIGGGTTDIAVVRNGGLEGTKMFALGGRAFTKKLAKETGLSMEQSEKLKLQYSLGKLSNIDTQKIDSIFRDDYNIWLGGVELALAEFSQRDLLPEKILMCGGGSGLPGIRKVLSSDVWIKGLAFSRSPEVNFLHPRDVVNVIDSTRKLNSTQDVTPLGLGNLVLDLVDREKILSGILKKAMNKVNYK